MMPEKAGGPLAGRLGVRLVAAVGLALMPLAVLAYVQAAQVQQEARARSEAALLGQTLIAVSPLIETISGLNALVRALSQTMLPMLDDPAACTEAFRDIQAQTPSIAFAGFVPLDGVITCSTTGEVQRLPDSPGRRALLADPRPLMSVNPAGPVTGESVLIFSHPVHDAEDRLLGFISASVPHRALDFEGSRPETDDGGLEGVEEPLALVTFLPDGTVLTSAFGMDTVASRLPRDRALSALAGDEPVTFTGPNAAGQDRAFAVLPVSQGELFVLSAWPTATVTDVGPGLDLPLWVFPLMMWLASLLVAWIAAEHQVLRHIRSLRRSLIAFAGGNRAVDLPDLSRAPTELRDVGIAYERLVDSVLHDEAALEDTVHQKEVLLREVHHRVKNNLQLIASIMNLQMRKAYSPEAKQIVKGLHDRVMSLATVHRELYQTTGLTDIRADELLSTIVAQVIRMGAGPDRALETVTDFDPIRMTPDQSVPLSLALTEALTNVLKHAGRGADGRLHLAVSLKRAGEGQAVLRVANSAGPGRVPAGGAPAVDSTGLGAQLIEAFAMQLSGDLTVGEDGDDFSVCIRFPLRALSEAEHRFADG